MVDELRKILRDVLALSAKDRAKLVVMLLDSLEPEEEAEWNGETARRATDPENGAAKTLPWSELRRNLLVSLKRHLED